jgi:hypothetical protein
VRGFVESGAVDGLDPYSAANEARRVRDAALEPYRQAAAGQALAAQVETAISMKSFEARSRVSDLLRAAGADSFDNIEAVYQRAVQLTRERAAQLDPAAGMFMINQQVGELLLAAVEEAVAEVAS